MKYEHHHHESTGLPRRPSSTPNVSRKHKGNDRASESVFSRVLGSFRRKRDEDKSKTSSRGSGERDWLNDYKGTHRPDRPLVDKQIQEKVSDEEYAARIQRIQERNQRFHGLSDRSRTPQVGILSRNNSAKTTGNYWGVPSPPVVGNIQRRPSEGVLDTRARIPISPVSPSAGTTEAFRTSALDRGPIIRYSAQSERRRQLPRTVSDTGRRYDSPASPRKRKRASVDVQAISQGAGASTRNTRGTENRNINRDGTEPDAMAPGWILNSSPTRPGVQRDTPSPAPTHHDNSSPSPAPNTHKNIKDYDNNFRAPSPEPRRRCPWRSCAAPLVTPEEKRDNLCAGCHAALYPRESAFFGPNSLVDLHGADTRGERDDGGYEPSPQDVDSNVNSSGYNTASNFGSGDFRLQPAPRSRGRELQRQQSVEERGDASERERGSISKRGSPSPSSSFPERYRDPSRRQHIGFQDARWFTPPPSAGRGSQSHSRSQTWRKPKPTAMPTLKSSLSAGYVREQDDNLEEEEEKEEEKEGEQEDAEAEEAQTPPRADSASDNSSWVTDTRSTDSSSSSDDHRHGDEEDEDEDEDGASPLTPTLPPSLPLSPSGPAGGDGREEEEGSWRSRDTLLYREIEDIIDCYAEVSKLLRDEEEGEGEGRRRTAATAAAVAAAETVFAGETEEAEMRRRGFI